MKVARLTKSLALAAAGLVPSLAQAQGFGLNEIGSCAVGRGFAMTAKPCDDASAIFWNPAYLTKLKGLQVYAGAAPVSIKGDFTEDFSGRRYDADVPIEVPPHLFASYSINPRLAAGLGVYVPYGLTSQWRNDFPGRFSALRASLATIYVQPTIAFDIVPGRFSIGGGPIFGRSTVELVQAIDLAPQVIRSPTTGAVVMDPLDPSRPLTFSRFGIPTGTEFGRARLQGSANAFGYQVGGHAKLTETLQLGVRWLSAVQFDYKDAEATFEQRATGLVLAAGNPLGLPAGTPIDALVAGQFQTNGTAVGALTSRTGSSAIKHPGQLQAGLAFTGLARTTLSADYTRFTWSDFETLPVNFGGTNPPPSRLIIEDYKDVNRFTVGIDHRLQTQRMRGFVNNWAVRAGFGVANSPAPDETVTPLLPEMDRKNYTVGLGIPLGDRFTIDAAYLRVDTDGRRGRIVERDSRTQTAESLNSGFYRLNNVDILSLSLRAQF